MKLTRLLESALTSGLYLSPPHILFDVNVAKSLPTSTPPLPLQQEWWYHIKKCLRSDLLACDARLSLFVAAATSYRYKALLRLLPAELQNIENILDTIVNLDRLERLKGPTRIGGCDCRMLQLLHTVLVQHGECAALSTLHSSEFPALYAHLKIHAPRKTPTQIFEVTPSLKCDHTKAYAQLREEFPVRLGFYGGRLDDLYAMLTVGSLPNDEPIELYSNMDAVLQQCPYAATWGASRCGAMLSCVAIVEYVMLPEQVSVCEKTGKVIVRYADCMQISYLMFFDDMYVPESEREVQKVMMNNQNNNNMRICSLPTDWIKTTDWLLSNKHALTLGIYMVCLPLTINSGNALLHKIATMGQFMLKKGFLQI